MAPVEADKRQRRRFREVGLGDADYQALAAFRFAIREFLAFSQQGALDHGITAQQHQALLAIRSHAGDSPMTLGELADSLLIKSHSAVGLVSRLEERDLVIRRPSPSDRRIALLELRPRGAEILEAISLRNIAKIDETSEILAHILQVARSMAERHRGGGGAAGDL